MRRTLTTLSLMTAIALLGLSTVATAGEDDEAAKATSMALENAKEAVHQYRKVVKSKDLATYRAAARRARLAMIQADPKGPLRPGLRFRYYETGALRRWRAPRAGEVRKFGVIATPTLEIDGRRQDNFAVIYEGYIRIPKDGIYAFSTLSDDGSALWLNGERIVDNDGRHGHIKRTNVVFLAAGHHAFRLGFFQWLGGKWLRVSWQPPGEKKQSLPVNVLFHAGGE
jgi:hypothetical protein